MEWLARPPREPDNAFVAELHYSGKESSRRPHVITFLLPSSAWMPKWRGDVIMNVAMETMLFTELQLTDAGSSLQITDAGSSLQLTDAGPSLPLTDCVLIP